MPKSSDNTLVASTPPWLKIATQITKMIKRALVFLKFIMVFWVKISGVGTRKRFCILRKELLAKCLWMCVTNYELCEGIYRRQSLYPVGFGGLFIATC